MGATGEGRKNFINGVVSHDSSRVLLQIVVPKYAFHALYLPRNTFCFVLSCFLEENIPTSRAPHRAHHAMFAFVVL